MHDAVSFARSLRRNQTPAERRFWALLSQWRSAGWHFRRQAVMGPFVVDFVCKRAHVIFEIDGDSHFIGDGAARDARRTAVLAGLGYRVVRFSNDDVMGNTDGVGVELVRVLGEADGAPPGWG